MLRKATIVEDSEVSNDVVSIGNFVKVYDMEFDEEETYKVVGNIESDPKKKYVSNESPMGMALLGAKVGDIVKSQDEFAVYTDNNHWEGSLKTFYVGQGYMLKRATNALPTKFYYPATIKKNNKPMNKNRSTKNYVNNMNIIGIVEDYSIKEGDSIVAIVQGEHRGAYVLENNNKVFLTIQGNNTADIKLLLKRGDDIIATSKDKLVFTSDSIIGTIESPKKINFAPMIGSNTISVTPRIVENELLVTVDDESINRIKIFIYSTDGIIVKETEENTIHNGHYTESFVLSNIPTGVYIVKIVVNDESKIVRIIKK